LAGGVNGTWYIMSPTKLARVDDEASAHELNPVNDMDTSEKCFHHVDHPFQRTAPRPINAAIQHLMAAFRVESHRQSESTAGGMFQP
jgi:hypothetical protein